jgi:hypothetical protein
MKNINHFILQRNEQSVTAINSDPGKPYNFVFVDNESNSPGTYNIQR